MTGFEIEVVPTEEIVKRVDRLTGANVNRLLLDLCVHVLIPFLMVGAISYLLGYVLARPWRYVAAAIIGCGIAFGIWMWWAERALHRQQVKASLETLRRMTCPSRRYQFTDDGVRSESELGFSFLKWRAFRKLSQVDEFWLLYWDEEHHYVFPAEVLNAEALKFLMRKCKENEVPLKTEWNDD